MSALGNILKSNLAPSLKLSLKDIDVMFNKEDKIFMIPGANQDIKLDGTFESITLKKMNKGSSKQFSDYEVGSDIYSSIGTFTIRNTDLTLTDQSYPIEFVLLSSNGEETTFKFKINLKGPEPSASNFTFEFG